MRIGNRKINPMMIELMIGIVLFGIIGTIVFVGLHIASVPVENFFKDSIFQIVIGYIIGIIFSLILIISMTASIEKALEMGEEGALKHTRIMYVVRLAALVLVFIIMLLLGIGNIFSLLFGLLSLKLSAYMQPITHKMISRLRTKESDLDDECTSLN